MNDLLRQLARLSGLRDRDEMDFALVTLLTQTGLWRVATIRLLRAVGPPDDLHWLTRAAWDGGAAPVQGDRVWADWSSLPALTSVPHRQAVIASGQTTCFPGPGGAHGFTTVFPIGPWPGVCSVLEVESVQPLPASALESIAHVLGLYQNLQGLLDYGEKDTLTELLNRKTFDGAFLRAAMAHQVQANPSAPERRDALSAGDYWLAIIDIDHFKHVNDSFGHLIGDEVLLLLARLMRASFRSHDQLYRFGGEEFVVLMRCAAPSDAAEVLERFRCRVQAHAFPQAGTITISIGFTNLQADDTPGRSFGRADLAVYYAKAHGRNQVCSYSALVQSGQLVQQAAAADEADFF